MSRPTREDQVKTVTFSGEVSSTSISGLIREINTLRDEKYFCDFVLEIDSPGGDVNALNYFLEAREAWKSQDIRLTTKALTECASAGAVMLSLGDVRKAAASSRLMYHNFRVVLPKKIGLTKEHALAVAESLRRTDDEITPKLAARAAEAKAAKHRSELDESLSESDKAMLRRMAHRLNDNVEKDGESKWIIEWLEETDEVVEAERLAEADNEKRESKGIRRWTELYEALFAEDGYISSRLAMTLRLIDVVENPGLMSWQVPEVESTVPSVRIREWKNAFPPNGDMPVEDLKRHTLVLGETGSGKTASVILPMLSSLCRSKKVGVLLVIDPKREIGKHLWSWNKAGEIQLTTLSSKVVMDLMEAEPWLNIDKMINQGKYWSAAEHVLKRVASLSHDSPARILLGRPSPHQSDPMWDVEALNLATAILAVAIDWIATDKPETEYSSGDEQIEEIRHGIIKKHIRDNKYEMYWNIDDPEHPCNEIRKFQNKVNEIFEAEAREYTLIADWVVSYDEIIEHEVSTHTRIVNRHVMDTTVPAAHQQDNVASTVVEYPKKFDQYDDDGFKNEEEAAYWQVVNALPITEELDSYAEEIYASLPDNLPDYLNEPDNLDDEMIIEEYFFESAVRINVPVFVNPQLDEGKLESVVRSGNSPWKTDQVGTPSAGQKALNGFVLQIGDTPGNIVMGVFQDGRPCFRPSAQFVDDEQWRRRIILDRLTELEERMQLDVPTLTPKAEEAMRASEKAFDDIEALFRKNKLPNELKKFRNKRKQFWNHEMVPGKRNFENRRRSFDKIIEEAIEIATPESEKIQTIQTNVLSLAESILNNIAGLVESQLPGVKEDQSGLQKIAHAYKNGNRAEDTRIGDTLTKFASMRETADKQYMGVYGSLAPIWREFIDELAKFSLYFGCEPAVRDKIVRKYRKPLLFSRAVGNRKVPRRPKVYLYQPKSLALEGLIAKVCKAKFFEAVLQNRNRIQDSRQYKREMPLVGYVADEFQRFVTIDEVHGEQSFLDTCRAFGAFAVLACQLVSSLRYAVCDMEKDEHKQNNGIDIIFGNTANKFFFRTSDKSTIEQIHMISPGGSDGIIKERPPAGLEIGECYASLADGRFDRIKLDQYTPRKRKGSGTDNGSHGG